MVKERGLVPPRFGNLLHGLTAIIILFHGYEKMEKGEASYWIFYVLGAMVIIAMIFHHRLAQKIKAVDIIFHGIEIIVLLLIAYDLFHHGKKLLPYMYLLAALGHIVATIIKIKKSNRIVPF